MAYYISEVPGRGNCKNYINWRKFIADFRSDIDTLPTTTTVGVQQGSDNVSNRPVAVTSEVFIIEDSSRWILGTHGWIQVSNSSTNSISTKGTPCTISSIVPFTEEDMTGQEITFSWTETDGTIETESIRIYNGKSTDALTKEYIQEIVEVQVDTEIEAQLQETIQETVNKTVEDALNGGDSEDSPGINVDEEIDSWF